jgi:hypothetical protein
MRFHRAAVVQSITRLYLILECAVTLYSLGVFGYIWLWMPRTRLRTFGLVVARMELIALFSALILLMAGIAIGAYCLLFKKELPAPLMYGILLILTLLLFDLLLLPPVVG